MELAQISDNSILTRRRSQALLEAFFIVVLVSWLPIKALSYGSPFLALGWVILRTSSGRTLIRSGVIAGAFLLIALFYLALSQSFQYDLVFHNILFALITYGSFVFMWAIPNWSYDQDTYRRMCRIVKPIIWIESAIGILQFMLSVAVNGLNNSTGDAVQGTIYLLAYREKVDMGLGNQIFAINMSMMLLFLVPLARAFKREWKTLLVGGLALLMAGVSHIFIPFVFAIALAFFFVTRASFRLGYKSLIGIGVVTMLGVFIVQSQIELIEYYVGNFSKLDSPKIRLTATSLTDFPERYPTATLAGVGPGQFTSRASLIGTGIYLNSGRQGSVFGFKPAMSEPFTDYVLPEYLEYSSNPRYGFSTMSRPFDSALSILTEFGWIVTLTLLWIVIRKCFQLRKGYIKSKTDGDLLLSNIMIASIAGIIFLVAISFFENYLEVPQAIFPGLMIMKVAMNLRSANGVDEKLT